MPDGTAAGSITLYVACSVDGYVATADGGVEWLDEFGEGTTEDGDAAGDGGESTSSDASGYDAFVADVDCLVVGSTTYEQILEFGEWPYDAPTYVVTSRDLPIASDAVELVDAAVEDLADRLRAEYEHVWLVGGAALAQSFLDEGALDELRLNVVPVVLGSGIALFDERGRRHDLALVDATEYASGIVELHYDVET